MAGLCLILSGFAVLLTWFYERVTTAPVIDDEEDQS